ncbi:uncharacterized protein TNCV_1295371 [Trichonephila clavipes]|nr:uncharacterized protein TNCV_1295371 [Trichonephila clavipes]
MWSRIVVNKNWAFTIDQYWLFMSIAQRTSLSTAVSPVFICESPNWNFAYQRRMRGKNQLRLTDGAHRYHRKRVVGSQLQILTRRLTGGAFRTSPKKKSSPGHLSRCFLTADSHWLGTRACAVSAISLRRCQSMFWVFHCNEFLTLKLGEWGPPRSPPRHSTGVPNDTVCMCVELVTNPSSLQILLSPDTGETKVSCPVQLVYLFRKNVQH